MFPESPAINRPGKNRRHLSWRKRAFDVVASVLGVILIAPLLGLIAALIRLFLGRPIFFRQHRPGLYGRPFEIIKFRTMTNAVDETGRLLPSHERLTTLGRFLRKASLDELPELFNVLKGDMSLVGPRPLLVRYLERYNPEQMRRHDVRPGITGWAQVNGRNNLAWESKFDMDVWYVDHQSLALDLKIIALTVQRVLRREGVDKEGYVGMEEFLGSNNAGLS